MLLYRPGIARLFLAVQPPPDVVEELMTLPRKDQRGVRFVPPENWHITVRFLGDAGADDVVAALAGEPLPPAEVRLGPAVDVLAERALVVPAQGVEQLAAAIVELTRHIGEPPPRRRYAGHLTLARFKANVPMPRALGTLVSAEFPADEVILFRSTLTRAGARYEALDSWPVG